MWARFEIQKLSNTTLTWYTNPIYPNQRLTCDLPKCHNLPQPTLPKRSREARVFCCSCACCWYCSPSRRASKLWNKKQGSPQRLHLQKRAMNASPNDLRLWMQSAAPALAAAAVERMEWAFLQPERRNLTDTAGSFCEVDGKIVCNTKQSRNDWATNRSARSPWESAHAEKSRPEKHPETRKSIGEYQSQINR